MTMIGNANRRASLTASFTPSTRSLSICLSWNISAIPLKSVVISFLKYFCTYKLIFTLKCIHYTVQTLIDQIQHCCKVAQFFWWQWINVLLKIWDLTLKAFSRPYPVSLLPYFAFSKALRSITTHHLSSQTLFIKPLLFRNNMVVTC